MSLLTVVQAVSGRIGLVQPSSVMGNTDAQIVQLGQLLNELLDNIGYQDWTATTVEATFTTVAVENQGNLATLAPSGFKWVIKDTIFDRTLRLPLYGPVMPQRWQQLKSLPSTGPFYKYRIEGGRFLMNPIPAAGHTIAFEYASSYLVISSDGATLRQYPQYDTDNFVIPEPIVAAGLRWKWKYEKGLDYAEDFRHFDTLLNSYKSHDANKVTIRMDAMASDPVSPGIYVQPGNWNLP